MATAKKENLLLQLDISFREDKLLKKNEFSLVKYLVQNTTLTFGSCS